STSSPPSTRSRATSRGRRPRAGTATTRARETLRARTRPTTDPTTTRPGPATTHRTGAPPRRRRPSTRRSTCPTSAPAHPACCPARAWWTPPPSRPTPPGWACGTRRSSPSPTNEPQQVCSPSPKPGTEGFHDLVLRTYPGTGDFGISRDCARGGRSEHKEGRAWDWGVDAYDPEQKEHAAEVIGWLLATDEY